MADWAARSPVWQSGWPLKGGTASLHASQHATYLRDSSARGALVGASSNTNIFLVMAQP
eukprot:CAMPEP_0183357108 /NCGR_PEP_ID=MMETSP0164_2-20130417/45384_1 /TAXON_ID=221442 /ORGANISM="Coccolithus pelagicus ssp braarudi, Strain PLY182g" /LENGTH=58 /DNA_ID=CAMNT_0025530663 /DNA_START=414 /DNA_END=590 /DNA_ORIENTATION=+